MKPKIVLPEAGGPAGLVWPAPAKLNLFLHITGRREDGYHELQTLYQFIDVGDSIDIRLRDDGRIVRRRGAPGVEMMDDLMVRAAMRLQQLAGTRLGAELWLHKRLPAGAGIGGGSSDAATTLVALNHLWGTGVDSEALARLGLSLGADVPVFVNGQAAWAEGLGERLQTVNPAPGWYLLVLPPCEVSTASAFAEPELTRNTPPITISDFFSGQGHNDFEPVVRQRYAQVDQALQWLEQFGRARLSGSGGACFVACIDADSARRASRALPRAMREAGFRAWAVEGLNRSPLLQRLALARQSGEDVDRSFGV